MTKMMDWYRVSILESVAEGNRFSIDDELQRQLATHVTVGWLRDLEGFGLDGLLGSLQNNASAVVLEHLAWYLGKELRSPTISSSEFGKRLRAKAREYWKFRVTQFGVQHPDPVRGNRRRGEADSFSFWLETLNAKPSEIETELIKTIPLFNIGLSLENVTQYLLLNVNNDLDTVAKILQTIVDRWIAEPELVWMRNSLDELLRAVANSGRPEDLNLIRKIISDLLESNREDYRAILSEN